MLDPHRRVEGCALPFPSYRRSGILHPHLRRSLDWSQPLMSEGDKGAVLALSAMIRQGMPSYSSVGGGWGI